MTHHGKHYQAEDVALLPATVQRPRPPVWVAGFWRNRRPMRRAARWDGAVPLFGPASHGYTPAAEDVRDMVAFVRQHREEDGPFEIVVGGVSPADRRDVVGPLADAGATWWDERQRIDGDEIDELAPVLRRIEQGPPAL